MKTAEENVSQLPEFSQYLVDEINGYQHMRDGWKEGTKDYEAYDLVIRVLRKAADKYIAVESYASQPSPVMSTEQVEELAEEHADEYYDRNSQIKTEILESIQWQNRKFNFIDGYNAATSPSVKPMSAEQVEEDAINSRFDNDKFIENVCLSYNHGFGLMAEQDKQALRLECKEWMRAIKNNWKYHVSSPSVNSMSAEQVEEDYILRTIDTDKWYWCKCESCGWEDSSEFTNGGSPIADTGDHTDPCCPVCSSTKLDGDSSCDVPQYSGVIKVKIPYDVYMKPYIKAVEKLSDIEFDKMFSSPSVKADGWVMPNNVTLKDIKAVRDYFGEHDKTIFEHRAFAVMNKLVEYFAPSPSVKADGWVSVDKEKEFQKVLKCLKNNKVMVDTREDGIYIRLAGRESEGEAFTLHFALAYPFPKLPPHQT